MIITALRPTRILRAIILCLGLTLAGSLPLTGAAVPAPGQPLPPWQPGMLDLHQINTGTGDSALFIFPDGTTLLLDAAGVNRTGERPPNYDAPIRPNATRRAGQFVARYLRRVHPQRNQAVLDDATESNRVLSVHGPYRSRGAPPRRAS